MGDPADGRAASTLRVVGVIHLPPLPGSPRGPSARDMNGILESVRRDAAAWVSGGADALIVENFGDAPFRGSAVGRSDLRPPATAIASTPTGRGYWVLDSAGTAFTYGDAPVFGSGVTEGSRPALAIVPIVRP